MLSPSTSSCCDICFGIYGQDSKAPWSITCGHIFCGECIQSIDEWCPLCRAPFERACCVKLHVDIDPDSGESSEVSAATFKEARRLQHAIASIPETGATEPSLRQLIQEGNKFLTGQPRNAHKDLRNAHRIIAYLYDVKMSNRAQAQAIDSIKEQLNKLTLENEDLQKKLEKQEEIRQYESETAAAVENTLREHCAQAKRAQKASSEQLKKLTEENEDLKKQVKLFSSKSMYGSSEQHDVYSTYKTIPSVFDRLNMKEVGIQDPSSFLISPLPQFANPLPSMFDSFSSLPDLAADETHDSTDEESDEEEEVHTPDSPQQPLRPTEVSQIRPQFAPGPVQPPRPTRGPLEPSGLSRTAPYRQHRRERSCSNPNPSPSSSRSQSPFDSIVSSTASMASAQATKHSPSSRDTYASQPAHLRSRLQDILTDTTTSSSLPILSTSYFPPSLSRDATQKDDRSQAGPSKSSESVAAAAPQASGSSSKTPRSTSPNRPVGTRMSSASAEAKKLEDERRRRYREEKYGPDYDRQSNEPDRDLHRYSASNTLSHTVLNSSSASQAARREQPYGNPLNPSPTMPILKRSSTTGAAYGKSSMGGVATASTLSSWQDQGLAPSGRVAYIIPGTKSSPKSGLINPMTYP